jgi:predicted transcriptional regulator
MIMEKKEPVITKNTRFSFAVVAILLGLSAWLTQIYFQGEANAQAINQIQTKQNRIDDMATDIAVIKSQVNEIRRKMDKLDP